MIHKTQKFNMKSERRAYREIYAFYFFCLFLKKVIKKLTKEKPVIMGKTVKT